MRVSSAYLEGWWQLAVASILCPQKRQRDSVTVLQESRLQLFLDAAKIPKFKILWDLRPRLNSDALTAYGVGQWVERGRGRAVTA